MDSHRIGRQPIEVAGLRRGSALILTCIALSGGESAGQATKAPAKPGPTLTAGQIAPDVLKRVKRATVHLKVTLPNGKSEGSGFFGVEPGIVLTNAHVLDMFRADSRLPVKVEVVVQSGQKDELTLTAQVLGVDTGSDLAVLRVAGANLPPPLEVSAAEELLETQGVYVFGFPFGSSLGKAITVNTSSVSSLRRNASGALERVQVNGGMNPGNSGGPVVDSEGKVVGVAVSVISQTQINFAIPGEAVHTMLAGKIHTITMEYPYQDGTVVKSRMRLRLLDPLNKINKTSLLVWTGATAKLRTEAPPAPTVGSPKRADATDLPVKAGIATVDLTLPAIAEPDVFWIQPSFTDAAGKAQRWLPILWPIKPPVERKPAVLALKHSPGDRNGLDLITNSVLTLRDAGGQEHSLVVNMKTGLVETVGAVSQGIADVRLNYSRISMTIKLDGKPLPRDKQVQALLQDLFKVGASLRVDAQGTLIDNRLELAAVPRGSREFVSSIASRIQKSFEAVETSLPGKSTEVNVPWTGAREMTIETLGDGEPCAIDMKYQYIGARKRKNVNEGLIDVKGVIKGRKGNGLNLGGRLEGLAIVDLDAGRVVEVGVTTMVDMDVTLNGQSGKANGRVEVRLVRTPIPVAAKNLGAPK